MKKIIVIGPGGSGKSYLTAALFNDLAEKNIKSVIVHVPELIRSIKDSFDKEAELLFTKKLIVFFYFFTLHFFW